MGVLHGLGSVADVLQHLSVGVGVLQSVSLELDSRQRSVDLGELLLVPLLSFQGLQSRCRTARQIGRQQKKKQKTDSRNASRKRTTVNHEWNYVFGKTGKRLNYYSCLSSVGLR